MGQKVNSIRQEIGIYTSWITLVTTTEHLLFTFVLLKGGVPDVEAIYFASIEQKKENCLQKLKRVLVFTKDAVICSANK